MLIKVLFRRSSAVPRLFGVRTTYDERSVLGSFSRVDKSRCERALTTTDDDDEIAERVS